MGLLEKGIEEIIRDKIILGKLYDINIKTVGELCNYTQRELQEKQIENFYIKDIQIALQCNGLDLKKKRKI